MQTLFAKIVALLTFFLSVMGIGAKNPSPEQINPEDFVPVLRFAAYSDTHVQGLEGKSNERVEMAVSFANSVADASDTYSKLDAVMFCGDLTGNGTVEQFEGFETAAKANLREDTKLLTIVAGNHDGQTLGKESLDYCQKISGNDSDFHVVINGYHFIGISSYIKSFNYNPTQIVWLRQQLNEAVLDDPEKPIFVTTHEHVYETVYGSSTYEGWGKITFKDVLNDYPQVIHLSGHSHYPLNDPRSIWQGDFTCIGTGTMSYAEMTVDRDRHHYPPGKDDATQGWIVEVDKENRVLLSGYEISTGTLQCQYLINDPDNKDTFEYTEAKQKAASSAPAFAKDAALTVTENDGQYTVTAPAALSTDGKIIFVYRIAVYDKLGIKVDSQFQGNNYFLVNPMETVSFTVEAEPGYTVKVTAENAYGMASEPLSAAIA